MWEEQGAASVLLCWHRRGTCIPGIHHLRSKGALPCSFHLQLHQVLVQLQTGEKEQDFSLLPIQVSISVQLWRLPGCHEFLAALGETAQCDLA